MNNGTTLIDNELDNEKTKSSPSLDSNSIFKKKNKDTLDDIVEEDPRLDTIEGWIIVMASFMSLFIVVGMAFSIGVFIQHYADVLFKDQAPLSTLTFIGTLSSSIQNVLAIFTGKLADKIGYRKAIFIGAAIISLGLLLASFSTQVWHLFLTQGVMVGIGSAIAFIPAISAPAQWFKKYTGLATGICVAGAGIGGLTLSPILQAIISNLGFRWALRVEAIVSVIVLPASAFFIKERVKTSNKGSWFNFKKFKDSRFLSLFLGGFLCSFGYLVPFLLMAKYARSIDLSESQGALLIGLLNGGSAVGRIVLGSLGDRFGKLNILFVCIALTSFFCYFIWMFAFSFGALLVFNILYGVSSGGFVSMLPAVTTQLFGVEGIASINGLFYFSTGIPNLVGTPIASAILSASSPDPNKPNYTLVIIYAGTSALLGAAAFFVLKLMVNRNIFSRV
ncbi:MFS general substrate transporter [Neoconidiobolus thromboides FSU 785]|nr:MFS general substrate transporter [Neoconidiobolus thromboides FSU 785]